jgi:hypothetical protein
VNTPVLALRCRSVDRFGVRSGGTVNPRDHASCEKLGGSDSSSGLVGRGSKSVDIFGRDAATPVEFVSAPISIDSVPHIPVKLFRPFYRIPVR